MKNSYRSLFAKIAILVLVAGVFNHPASLIAAAPGDNLIQNPSLETEDAPGVPHLWYSNAYKNTASFSYPVTGADGETDIAARTTVSAQIEDGDAKWYFEPVIVSANSDYVYRETYRSDVATHLILAEIDASNTYTFTEIMPTVPASSTAWASVAVELHTKSTTAKLSIYHSIQSMGMLEIDEASLSLDSPLQVTDFIPNNSFEQASAVNADLPRGWTQAGYGANTRTFQYVSDGHDGSRSAKVTVTGYTDGDAKWMFAPQALVDGNDYTFSGWYKTDTIPRVVAQFTYANGSVSFQSMPNPQPASDSQTVWQHYASQFSVPDNAVSTTVFFYLSGNGSLQVDDLHINSYTFQGFHRPIISLTFDDGFPENASTVLPTLTSAGFLSTQYYPSQSLAANDPNIMAFFNAGHEIADHTITHPDLTTISQAAVETELTQSKATLESIIHTSVIDFASPFGAYNAAVNTQIAAHFQSHRTVDEGYNSVDNLDLYRLRVQNMRPTTTLDEFKGWVNKAIEDKTWLIIVYHKVSASSGELDSFDTRKTDFDQQMAWLKTKTTAGAITVERMDTAIAEVTGKNIPVIAAHDGVTVEATVATGVTVTYTLPAVTDDHDTNLVATCTPASGTTFAIGTTTVTCSATDSDGNAAVQKTFVVTVTDSAPTITLTGDASVTVEYGSVYTDAGATATDTINGSLTASIVATGAAVDTHVLGDHTVTYHVSDSHGNNATAVTRTVHVIARPITITAAATTKVFGSDDPTFVAQVTAGTLIEGDTMTGTLARDAGESVGTYAITQGDLSLGAKYAITFVPGTFTITVQPGAIAIAPQTLTATYDGTPKPVTVSSIYAYTVTYTGITDTVYATSATAPSAIGSYTVVAAITDPNHAASVIGTLSINKAHSSGSSSVKKKSTTVTPVVPTVPKVLGATTTTCPATFSLDLSIGSKGDDVKKLQAFLNTELHLALTTDGGYGPKTAAAVKSFQLAHTDKISTATGSVDLATRMVLNTAMCKTAPAVLGATKFTFTQTLKVGMEGSEVMELQKKLTKDGFLKVPYAGYFGLQTKAAVIAYQTAHHLTADGVVGALTRAFLNQ